MKTLLLILGFVVVLILRWRSHARAILRRDAEVKRKLAEANAIIASMRAMTPTQPTGAMSPECPVEPAAEFPSLTDEEEPKRENFYLTAERIGTPERLVSFPYMKH